MALINYLTRIHFADGVLEDALRAEVEGLGMAHPLLVTDRGLVATGLVDRALSALPSDATPEVFDETPSNPTEVAQSDDEQQEEPPQQHTPTETEQTTARISGQVRSKPQ